MSIFDQILSAAAEGAAQGAQTFATPLDFDGARLAPTPDFVPTVHPAGKADLHAYQWGAVQQILDNRRALLGYQPGMGKTAIMQAVIASEALLGRTSLVVVPPSLRISPWKQEFALDYPHLNVVVVEGRKAEPVPTDADVVIIGDSILADRLEDVQAWGPDNLFCDEAHRLKSFGQSNKPAQRAKAFVTLADSLPLDSIVCCATGTIVSNHGVDAYGPLRASGKRNATAVSGGFTFSTFRDSWFDTVPVSTPRGTVRKIVGCRDARGLRDALLRSCYLSVPRAEVLDLPKRSTAVRSLVLNGDAEEYRRMEKNFLAWVRAVKGDAAYRSAAKAEAITRLTALWQADGKAKVKASTEYIEALVEQGEQVLVFAVHRDEVINPLYEALLKAGLRVGTIVGGMTSGAKAQVVEDFQAGRLDVILGNVQAAGEGITLTAACHVVFVQVPFAPGAFNQAQDRIYRIGQSIPVTTHVLNMYGGLSERLWDVLVEKAKIADAINTGTESTMSSDSVEEAVLESYGW